jgi:hypothetical protein
MGTKPRTPEQYPRMKQRGGRRHNGLRATQQRTAARTVLAINWAAVGAFLSDTARAVIDAFANLAAAFKTKPRPDDYALTDSEEDRS